MAAVNQLLCFNCRQVQVHYMADTPGSTKPESEEKYIELVTILRWEDDGRQTKRTAELSNLLDSELVN